MFSLDGKTALITGGARGLGKEIATALAQMGSRIVLADVDAKLVEEAASEIASMGVKALGLRMDVTNESEVQHAIRQCEEMFGALDVVVNNAGIVDRVGIEDMSLERWNRLMSINLTGVFLVSKHSARSMITHGVSGSIINMASMSGMIVNVPMEQAAYNTSKAAVIMLTKSCAMEWAEYGIRVNAIAPGYMKTDMTGPDFEPGGVYHHLLEQIPMRRLGLPRELGGLAVWLASEASSYVTGATIPIDGGYTLP
ncbi:SDR family NAD(P)-dependent oxidoreductase [Alicyclobacillus kakegawensis]|uniref:SDR family NAD(P)-dependent oxidoreductase n=1 Tax=Alicyclobacillus kakegawensis TaxID=392012 RepID=UPI000837A3A3|nr:glucose 1-dehydrogenase [Alicyclobacillus kakegawensis]